MVEPPHGRVGEGLAQDTEPDESEAPDADAAPERRTRVVDAGPVSYTHLTLPTN